MTRRARDGLPSLLVAQMPSITPTPTASAHPARPRFGALTAWRLALGAAVLAAGTAARAETVQIIDGGGLGRPMPAATVQLPSDWRASGGVQWNPRTNCASNKVGIAWQARSRDDMFGFEVMPGYAWQLSGTQIQMNPCPAQPFRSLRDFMAAVVHQRRSNAQVIDWRDRPDIVAILQAGSQGNNRTRLEHQAGEALIAYRSDGVEFREVLSATMTLSELGGNVVGNVPMVFAYRAPSGRLDFDAGEAMQRSFRYERQWGEGMIAVLRSSIQQFSSQQSQAIASWHAREMARINAEGAADRAAIRAATSREVARINSQTAANTSATNDRMHRRTMEGIGEYNTYATPSGGTVQSSIHGGSRVLQNPSGTVFSTNDPYFNPAGSRELQRVR